MPPAERPNDVTVCSTSQALSFDDQSPRLSAPSRPEPARCQSYCCSPSPATLQLSRGPASCYSYSSSPARSCCSDGTDGSSYAQSEDGAAAPDFGDHIDSTTFEQILEMDDDEEEREFSKSIVYDFFQQADSTFQKMDANLEKEDLDQLSALGHFLKGSSATLGLTKVKDSCEKIQHFGAQKDETGTNELDAETCLKNLRATIAQAKEEFKEVERLLRRYYHDE